jgi:Lrp/AsnC family transcriptional regulator, leucine-responsive regulatory protein
MPSNRRETNGSAYAAPRGRLDDSDCRILAEFLKDPRVPMATLAKRVGMSRPAVTERIRKLGAQHVIVGHRIELDPIALGFPYTVFIRVRPSAGQADAIEELARVIPGVVECYRMTGEDSILIKAHVRSVPELEEITARIHRHGETVVSDVLSVVVPSRAPPLTFAVSSHKG